MYCIKCGTKLEDNEVFCHNCGTKVNAAFVESETTDNTDKPNAQQPKEKKPKKPINKKKIIIICIIVMVVLAIAAAVLYFVNAKKQYDKANVCISVKDYQAAKNILVKLGNYKDSKELLHMTEQELCNHDFTYEITLEATCTTNGIKKYTCTKCGKEKEEIIIGSHSYEHTVLKKATCTQVGKYKDVCSVCGNVVEGEIPKVAHNYSKATCISPAKCTVCGAINGSALGHDYNYAFCPRCGVKLFTTKTYSGYGPGSLTNITLPKGLYNIKFTYSGDWNFIVYLNDALIVNEIGATSYVKQLGYGSGFVESGFQYLKLVENNIFNITNANGAWTITIEAIK